MKHLLLILFLLSSSLTFAQDIYQKNLYSADRVMENREKLKLSDVQVAKIKKIHAENAGEFSTLKWDLDAANAKLKNMLEASRIDQIAVNKQMDEVLRLESLLKKKQLNTLVGIKNELTESQQQQLASLNPVILMGSGTFGSVQETNQNSKIKVVEGKALTTDGSAKNATILSPDSENNKVMIKVNSYTAGNQPLYVINGKVLEEGQVKLKDIDPNSIESISVLKDKSATDLYGEKGNNGVIIITLKKNSKYYFQKNN